MQKSIYGISAICFTLFIFSCNNGNSSDIAKTDTTHTTKTKPVTQASLKGDYFYALVGVSLSIRKPDLQPVSAAVWSPTNGTTSIK